MSNLEKKSNLPAASQDRVNDLIDQSKMIKLALQTAMVEGEHYGTIPGTKNPTLYKQGAEKISTLFRLAPSYEIKRYDLQGEHREYEVVCTLTNINSGQVFGQGVGSCSSLETKYRYRNDTQDTGEPIPGDYQQNKGYYRAQGFVSAKIDGEWKWCTLVRVDHDNPADYYNTVLKMAKKRAHVDAVTTATACSDVFSQDLEDLLNNGIIPDPDEPASPPSPKNAKPGAASNTGRLPWINSTDKDGLVLREWEAKISDFVATGRPWSEMLQDLKKSYSIPKNDEAAMFKTFKHFKELE